MEPQVVALVIVGVMVIGVYVRSRVGSRANLKALGVEFQAETTGTDPRAQLHDATSELDILIEDCEGGGAGGASGKRLVSRRGGITVRNAPSLPTLPKGPHASD